MTIRLLFFSLLLAGTTGSASAQPTPPAPPATDSATAVRATIDALFDGMRAGDSSAVRAVFHPDARLQTALGPADTAAVRATSVDGFVEAVGRSHEKVWDERIWDVQIDIDGPLASAWVPYVFYHGEAFSHCGVNAIQLVRQERGWRILQLTDTRRTDCDIPADVQN